MKKMIIFLAVLCLLFAIPSYAVFAGEVNQNFTQELPVDWIVYKENSSTTVQIVEEKLKVENAGGHTEIRLPDTEMNEFALTFKAKRFGGDTMTDWDYPSFGVKYYMNDDYSEGYEIKVHYKQKKPEQSSYTDIFWDGNGDTLQTSGCGFEHRIINPNDEENQNKLLMFNFYKTSIYEDIEYEYSITVKNGVMQFWVNGDVWLKDVLETDVTSGKTAICLDGQSTVIFDDFRIYSLEQFANEKISAIPSIESGKEYSIQMEYEAELIEAEKFITETFGENKQNLTNYSDLVKKQKDFEKAYGVIKARTPVISVEWTEDTITTGSKIFLPVATAVDQDGTYYFVESSVIFNGKTLKKANNTVTVNEAGEYTVKYVAKNSFGEAVEKTLTFTVAEATTPVNVMGILIWTGAGVLLAGAVTLNLVLLIRRKKK